MIQESGVTGGWTPGWEFRAQALWASSLTNAHKTPQGQVAGPNNTDNPRGLSSLLLLDPAS